MKNHNKFTYNEVHDIILYYCQQISRNNNLTDKCNLTEALDSLDIVELTLELEREFMISMDDNMIEKVFYSSNTTIIDVMNGMHNFGILTIKDIRNEKLNKIQNGI